MFIGNARNQDAFELCREIRNNNNFFMDDGSDAGSSNSAAESAAESERDMNMYIRLNPEVEE